MERREPVSSVAQTPQPQPVPVQDSEKNDYLPHAVPPPITPSNPAQPTVHNSQLTPSDRETVSIKLGNVEMLTRPKLSLEGVTVTQEQLTQYWNEIVEDYKQKNAEIAALLQGKTVELKERGLFYLVVDNSYFEKEFSPYRIEVLNRLRERCGMPMLSCRIVVHVPESEAIVFDPKKKYEAMLQRNPRIAILHDHFQDIDF